MDQQVQNTGPTYCDEGGKLAQLLQYQEYFVYFQREIQQEHPDIIPDNVDVGGYYVIVSYIRRGAESITINISSNRTTHQINQPLEKY